MQHPPAGSVAGIAPPSFVELGLDRRLLAALGAARIVQPFAVQTTAIPPILSGRDVAAQAPTGSGKTLAFGLPLLARLADGARSEAGLPRALILAPTRELARQIADALEPLAAAVDRSVHTFYGGVAVEPQIEACEQGVDVAVACPGRLLDLIERGHISLRAVEIVVVDEADRMADMGFLPDVVTLLDTTPIGRQTLLFSATLDGDVHRLVREHQRDAVRVDVRAPSPDELGDDADVEAIAALPSVHHHLWSVAGDERTELTAAIIQHCGPTMVFVRTRHGAERLATRLSAMKLAAMAMHGGNSQLRRDQALDDFRAGRLRALVATDVAARGVHVDDVACVVQYDLPVDPKDYVHRAGRTGRAGSSGAVVTLVPPTMVGRAVSMMDESGLSAATEVAVTRPDLDLLESADQRRRIDRQLAALDQLRRPGAVGAVSFARPTIPREPTD